MINGLDPYLVEPHDVNFTFDAVPPVSYMDIISYLVLSHSYYTKEHMKAFKSLQAYKYFISGFVEVGTKMVDELYILIGKVRFFN